jgi:hypothetical protein
MRDQKRIRDLISTYGDTVKSRVHRVEFQYLQAMEVCDLLSLISDKEYGFASAVLFRFGLDTLAMGFWIACVASNEWLNGEEGQPHIASEITGVIRTLPRQAQDMLQEIIDSRLRLAGGTYGTLLHNVLNPATHGDALVSVIRIGSAEAQGGNWPQNLSATMKSLTDNFVILVRELTGIDPSREGTIL